MSLLFAGFNFLVRSCNDSLLHRDLDNAHANRTNKREKKFTATILKRISVLQTRDIQTAINSFPIYNLFIVPNGAKIHPERHVFIPVYGISF